MSGSLSRLAAEWPWGWAALCAPGPGQHLAQGVSVEWRSEFPAWQPWFTQACYMSALCWTRSIQREPQARSLPPRSGMLVGKTRCEAVKGRTKWWSARRSQSRTRDGDGVALAGGVRGHREDPPAVLWPHHVCHERAALNTPNDPKVFPRARAHQEKALVVPQNSITTQLLPEFQRFCV